MCKYLTSLRLIHIHFLTQPSFSSSFVPGAYFDIRVELHAYGKDSSAPTPSPYTNFTTTIRKNNGKWHDINDYFKLKKKPALENWKFNWTDSIDTYYASLLKNDQKPIPVAVTSRAWRKVKLTEPGEYEVKVTYGNRQSYSVKYVVVEPKKPKKKAKNVILFISDGTNVGVKYTKRKAWLCVFFFLTFFIDDYCCTCPCS